MDFALPYFFSQQTGPPMLLLFETPAGYSLFKVKDEDKLKDIDVRVFCLFFVIIRVVGFFFSSHVKEKGIADFFYSRPPPILSQRGQLTRDSLGERV